MIELDGVTKRYGALTAVDDLSFSVPSGQVTGFLGPNGAGKSTTLGIILGLVHQDSGTALIDGRPYRELPLPLREVGAVLEAKAFHPSRSPRDHLRVLARANRIPDRRVDEVLEQVGLAHAAARSGRTLSLGMGQRLGVAAALLGDPHTLILDEPVNGLDPEGISWLRTLLRGYAREGRTVLVSSHLMAEMAQTADRVVVINRGALVVETDMASLLAGSTVRVEAQDPARLARALSAKGATVEPDGTVLRVRGMDRRAIGEEALALGVAIYELATESASLEEAFMALVRGPQEEPVA
jgi:ABC-2 type transport system ATP-binding protein